MNSISGDISEPDPPSNENARDRTDTWLRDGVANIPNDDLKTHLDAIFAAAVPESLLPLQDKRHKLEHGAEYVDTLGLSRAR